MEAADVKNLQELAKSDRTVATFLDKHYSGRMDFETMVIRLAVQLSREKVLFRDKLKLEKESKQAPSLFDTRGL